MRCGLLRVLEALPLLGAAGCVEEHPLWQVPATDGASGTAGTGGEGATVGTVSGTATGPATGGATDSASGNSSSGGVTATTGGSSGEGSGGSSGGSTGGSTGGSSGGAQPDCVDLWLTGDFVIQPPEKLDIVNTNTFEGDPFLSGDGLTLYFASDRGNAVEVTDLYRSTRANRDAPFEAPGLMPNVNTSDSEWTLAPTADGLLAFFISDRSGGPGNSDVWQVTRPSTQDFW